jgi:acylphosphatase
VLEGEQHAVARVVSWMRIGPPRAEVDGIRVIEEPTAGEGPFTVR